MPDAELPSPIERDNTFETVWKMADVRWFPFALASISS